MIVQAGQSEDGRGFAAAHAEVIFTAHQRKDTAQEFYADIKSRARGLGRNPDHVLIMPGVSPFIGRTRAEAQEKYDRLTDLILPEDGIGLLNGLTGGTLDLRGYDLDGPLPPAPPTEGMKSRQALIRQIADENNFTIRQPIPFLAGEDVEIQRVEGRKVLLAQLLRLAVGLQVGGVISLGGQGQGHQRQQGEGLEFHDAFLWGSVSMPPYAPWQTRRVRR